MQYVCKQCNEVIKRKPKIYDDYYFCDNDKCVWEYINKPNTESKSLTKEEK